MSLRIALLGLLEAAGPASGYDLAKKFEHSLNHVWQAQHSQIYPELVKMAADGLVTVESEGARGRKIYQIAPEGAEQLHTWLIDREPVTPTRNEAALQTFLLPLLETHEAIEVLARIRDRAAARLITLEGLRGHEGDKAFGRYALRFGICQVRATLDWADEVIAELGQPKASTR